MASFQVTQVIDGDTFDVSPRWSWNHQTGTRVRPAGFDTPEMGSAGAAASTARLRQIIGGRSVELREAHTVDRGRLVCEVFVDGRNLAEFFRRYRA